MFRQNTCPNDRQQIEFFGIAHYRIRDRRTPVKVRWSICGTCGGWSADNMRGKIVAFRAKGYTPDEITKLFPTTREKRFPKRDKND